jgi:RNA polymerase sigma-70 factor (ECF subfamily)
MVERSDNFGSAGLAPADTNDAVARADAWFAREILPLEASLMQFLQHNWRHKAEIADLRQEVYARVYESAVKRIPEKPKHFLFATARNLLIDRARQARVIPIDAASDIDVLDAASDTPGPDQIVMARDELRRLQAALEKLSPRCREAVVLARIQGLSRREIAQRMGVTEGTAAQYLAEGIASLVEHLQRGGRAKP